MLCSPRRTLADPIEKEETVFSTLNKGLTFRPELPEDPLRVKVGPPGFFFLSKNEKERERGGERKREGEGEERERES